MDHNVPSAITSGLRILGVDVLTAYEDNQHQTDDPELLDRAATLERVLFTRDDDFIVEANRRQREAIPFYGIVYAHQLRVPIGAAIHDLDLLAKTGGPADFWNTLYFLPL